MTCREAKAHYGLSRRAALQIGAGLFGLTLPGYLLARETAPQPRRDVSCIFIFLAGGPSHFETFDPKPEAPVEIRGLWKPISTSVPGIQIAEKMPLLAKRMEKVALIRSWQGVSGSHATGSQHVASGMVPPRAGQYFPNFGNLVGALYGSKTPGIAPHYGLPTACRYTSPSGYLGAAQAAFDIHGDPASPDLELEKLRLPRGRFEGRQGLLAQIENLGRLSQQSDQSLQTHEKFIGEATAMLTSGAMQKAVDLAAEPTALRERYGMNPYGQRVLLARRLIEAGARFVTINQAVQGGPYTSPNLETAGTWDNHTDIFRFLMSFSDPPRGRDAYGAWNSYPGPGNLPQLDMSLSALLDDLEDRGMLDSTLVVVMGEFGRTPKLNAKGGRDHYPKAGSVLMAGGGVQGGAVIGATDKNGAEPNTRPWKPEDFAASIYHSLGIDHRRTYFPRLPRPTPIADGQVIDGLFG
jgi:uncharacterized protein (DUF1501 family)